eukprot:Rmarinus@m.17070
MVAMVVGGTVVRKAVVRVVTTVVTIANIIVTAVGVAIMMVSAGSMVASGKMIAMTAVGVMKATVAIGIQMKMAVLEMLGKAVDTTALASKENHQWLAHIQKRDVTLRPPAHPPS